MSLAYLNTTVRPELVEGPFFVPLGVMREEEVRCFDKLSTNGMGTVRG
ncbi:hypothetical protein ACFSC3_13695 [Sphingomonas floccifaciens]|uniref:Uncharacterized protein n=1 Tax=Sphingomonas floccifaciens TaxID=1844115 RepID=A0ABW4NGG9_9SPHN